MRLFRLEPDLGLLFLRVAFGSLMILGHGLEKLSNLLQNGLHAPFGDPLGIGSPWSLLAATGAEVGASLLVILGFQTRLAAAALVFTMGVAAFLAHGADSFYPVFLVDLVPEHPVVLKPFKEYPLLYASAFMTVLLTGAGKYSIDRKLRRTF